MFFDKQPETKYVGGDSAMQIKHRDDTVALIGGLFYALQVQHPNGGWLRIGWDGTVSQAEDPALVSDIPGAKN